MPDTDGIQATLDQGIPLSEVTFCVVDLETTGGSPASSAITEIGAVKYRGGERIGVFQTFVDPRQPIPPFITHLTGITDEDVSGAPPIEAIVPSLAEFLCDGVFVAHNASFDLGFVNAAFQRLDYEPLRDPPICTARLARRVIRGEVRNVKLHTLAEYFRCRVQPTHRALDDAEACAEVLHGLLEHAGRMGILTLGDLHQATRARGQPHFAKIRLTDDLPQAPGVYLFRNKAGAVLYVGKAKDLRSRVKSYFYGDGRKKVDDLLSELATIDTIVCPTELEALVLEARLIQRHEPKYNRRGKGWRRYAYLKIDTAEAWPRIKVVREPKGDATFLGPFVSGSRAQRAKEALEDLVPIRRCTKAMGAATRFSPCALADMGRCAAPCDGRVDPERYEGLIRGLISSLDTPDELLGTLEDRMYALAAAGRFEEAAEARDRLRALVDALARTRMDAWIRSDWSATDGAGNTFSFAGGALVRKDGPAPVPDPCPRERADELAAVRGWLQREPVRLSDGTGLSEPVAGGATIHRLQATFRTADRALVPDRYALR